MIITVDFKDMNRQLQIEDEPKANYNLIKLKVDGTDEPENTYRVLFETYIGNNRKFVVLNLMQEGLEDVDSFEAEIFELIGNTYYSVADKLTEKEVLENFKKSRVKSA